MVLQEVLEELGTLARTLTERNCVVWIKIDPDGTAWLSLGSETVGRQAAKNTNPSACPAQPQHGRSNRDWCAFHCGRHSWRSSQLPRPRQQPVQQQQRRTREPHHYARRSARAGGGGQPDESADSNNSNNSQAAAAQAAETEAGRVQGLRVTAEREAARAVQELQSSTFQEAKIRHYYLSDKQLAARFKEEAAESMRVTAEREAVTERVAVEEAGATATYDNSQAAPGEADEQSVDNSEAAAEGEAADEGEPAPECMRVAAEREAAPGEDSAAEGESTADGQQQPIDNSQARLVMGAWSGDRRKAWIPPGHIRAKWGDPAEKREWFRKRQRKQKEKRRRNGEVDSGTGISSLAAGSGDTGESELRARETPAASEEVNSVVQLQREKE